MTKFIDVTQEVEEWFSRLTEKDMIPMLAQAVLYAAGCSGKPAWKTLTEVIDRVCNEKEESLKERLIKRYGVFASGNSVRVVYFVPEPFLSRMSESARTDYNESVLPNPDEGPGRSVEALDRDMAIYTAGLLDGIDQAEIQQDAREYELAGYPRDDFDDLEDR